jgi:hypothetical protein
LTGICDSWNNARSSSALALPMNRTNLLIISLLVVLGALASMVLAVNRGFERHQMARALSASTKTWVGESGKPKDISTIKASVIQTLSPFADVVTLGEVTPTALVFDLTSDISVVNCTFAGAGVLDAPGAGEVWLQFRGSEGKPYAIVHSAMELQSACQKVAGHDSNLELKVFAVAK